MATKRKKKATSKGATGPKRGGKAKAVTKARGKAASKAKGKTTAKASAKAKGKPAAKRKPAAKGRARAQAKTAARPQKKAAAKPRVRRDATGHLNPSYAKDLRRLSRENVEHDDDRAFLVGERADDALAQELGTEFVETVTSGEDEGTELRDADVPEERGGPFVTTTEGTEFAEEPDASNPLGATREPFPKT